MVGDWVCFLYLFEVLLRVGLFVGDWLGFFDGLTEGDEVGDWLGFCDGLAEGSKLGALVGLCDGFVEGDEDGIWLGPGLLDGPIDGDTLVDGDKLTDGATEGTVVIEGTALVDGDELEALVFTEVGQKICLDWNEITLYKVRSEQMNYSNRAYHDVFVTFTTIKRNDFGNWP